MMKTYTVYTGFNGEILGWIVSEGGPAGNQAKALQKAAASEYSMTMWCQNA